MWILLAMLSALGLGVYDIFKKKSLTGNDVFMVLFCTTAVSTLLLSPYIVMDAMEETQSLGDSTLGLLLLMGKAVIVLSSWALGYAAIKHLPLTITGPINATRPLMVLVGALLIFGESLNLWQWGGIVLGVCSLLFISRLGRKEGFTHEHAKWLWCSMGAAVTGALSGLYDRHLMTMLNPLEVQSWYSLFQTLIMAVIVFVMYLTGHKPKGFKWVWTIPMISVCLTLADIAYFYSLSQPDAKIAVVSMMRRGSVIVSFLYGVIVLKEKNARMKALDLLLLLIGLILLAIGSQK